MSRTYEPPPTLRQNCSWQHIPKHFIRFNFKCPFHCDVLCFLQEVWFIRSISAIRDSTQQTTWKTSVQRTSHWQLMWLLPYSTRKAAGKKWECLSVSFPGETYFGVKKQGCSCGAAVGWQSIAYKALCYSWAVWQSILGSSHCWVSQPSCPRETIHAEGARMVSYLLWKHE